MPDDLSELEDRVNGHQGIENHPYGYMLLRLMRLVKSSGARLRALEDRVKALEDAPP